MRYSLSHRVHDRGGHAVSHRFIYAYWAFKVKVEVLAFIADSTQSQQGTPSAEPASKRDGVSPQQDAVADANWWAGQDNDTPAAQCPAQQR